MDNLWNQTGHNSIDERNTEAERYIDELSANLEPLLAHERSFIIDMSNRKDNNTLRCSAKQLFWLRDLYEKYCI